MLAPTVCPDVAQDAKEPRPTIGSPIKALEVFPSPKVSLLHEVIGGFRIRQVPRAAIQGTQVWKRELLELSCAACPRQLHACDSHTYINRLRTAIYSR